MTCRCNAYGYVCDWCLTRQAYRFECRAPEPPEKCEPVPVAEYVARIRKGRD